MRFLRVFFLRFCKFCSAGPAREPEAEGIARCAGTQANWTVPDMLREKHGWWPDKAAARHVRFDSMFLDNIWIGDNGLCTPLHYDKGHGLLTQIRGTKRVTIFPPSDFQAMVALPTTHPGARG